MIIFLQIFTTVYKGSVSFIFHSIWTVGSRLILVTSGETFILISHLQIETVACILVPKMKSKSEPWIDVYNLQQ